MKKKVAKQITIPNSSLKRRGKKGKVLIAMSGGIDSAVSAYLLLKQGYGVEAAFMKNWSSTTGLLRSECPWLADRQDALRVAAFLKIPLHTLDFEQQYQDTVMNYFFKEYEAGRTPNPDVMCNKEIKFKLLYNWAMENGFDYLATGHYAQVCSVPIYGRLGRFNKNQKPINGHATSYQLIRSKDEFKDQTYFIYNINQNQLPHLLFPIGGMKKSQVKVLAEKIGLPNAGKKESMGLCFVGKIRLKDFLEQKIKPKPGPIIFFPSLPLRGARALSGDAAILSKKKIVSSFAKTSSDRSDDTAMKGQVIGHHAGLYNYTLGQRQGIHIGASGPYYVYKKDLASNSLFVTNNPDDSRLLMKEIYIHSVHWIGTAYKQQATGNNFLARFRHQGKLVPVIVQKRDNHNYEVIFKYPQKAVASGQSLVIYKGKECLGGGVVV